MPKLLFAIFLCPIAASAAAATAQIAGSRAEVPIRAVVLPDGVRRYSITLKTDGRPIEAQLDTGSTGLRVLKTDMTGTIASARGPTVRYSCGSGVELVGAKVSATIELAGLTGVAPIERVETVECTDRKPECPAAAVSATDFRIGGNGIAGQASSLSLEPGYAAIIVPNPLVALGVRRWIVDLPRDGEGEGG